MSLESILIIAGVVSIFAAFLFFVLARRLVRLAIRLFIVFAVILIMAGAALFFGWRGSNDNKPPQQNRPANTRRGNSR